MDYNCTLQEIDADIELIKACFEAESQWGKSMEQKCIEYYSQKPINEVKYV